jgi:Fic family protein
MTKRRSNINALISHLKNYPDLSSRQIFEQVAEGEMSFPTVKRMLAELISQGYLSATGQGKSTKYRVNAWYDVIRPFDVDEYFKKEIDDRSSRTSYNHELIRHVLNKITLFTEEEMSVLNALQARFNERVASMSKQEFLAEQERLAIDLSWKSSQIEGNTYSLLETEQLLLHKTTAAGKTKDEAVMLLNHKDAIDYIAADPQHIRPLRVSVIEEVHSLLVKELGVDRNIRRRTVGISGTNYRPLENEFQIREALEEMCGLVNLKDNVFEKAFLVLLLISYIQPFNDGSKRTARIISNAMLMSHQYCPVSFRTVDPLEYKKAMLVFYEQNNVTGFKKIFLDQFEFAVNTYF